MAANVVNLYSSSSDLSGKRLADLNSVSIMGNKPVVNIKCGKQKCA